MNKYLKIIVIAVASILLSSCADPDLSPIITFDQATKGAYVKLLNESARLYDKNNTASAEYTFDVEFIDSEDGALVTNYNINVEYVDSNPGNGDASVAPTQFRSLSPAEFGTSVNGKVGTTITVKLTELASTLNLNVDDILALDEFLFTSCLTLSDGLVFCGSNSSAAVNGPAFAGHFDFTVPVTCPVPDDKFVGAYTLEYVGNATTGFGELPWGDGPQTVTLTAVEGSKTKRTFTGDNMLLIGDSRSDVMVMNIELLCSIIRTESTGSGLGCADELTIGQGTQADSPFNFDDDSSITLTLGFNLLETCGGGEEAFQIRLTKQ